MIEPFDPQEVARRINAMSDDERAAFSLAAHGALANPANEALAVLSEWAGERAKLIQPPQIVTPQWELEQKQRLRAVEKRLMEAANGYIVALNRFAGAWVSTPRIQ